ncbi:MAG: DnaJ C-terminal domain-containing protein [Betaproteobacteria bacterium]
MQFKDYYEVMGVPRDASAEQIKRAYRQLARKHHPDVSKAADAEARFKELGEAYEVLKDPGKRASYDQLGADWKAGQDFRPPPDWGTRAETPGTGFSQAEAAQFSDFFESLFGREHAPRGARGTRSRQSHAQGEDHHARIQIDLEDSYQGAQRSISLRVPQLDAQGQVTVGEHEVSFKLPRGVRAGQQIRLAGQGGPGVGDGPPGDLYLEVEFRPHAHYRVHRHDVYLDLPVAPWEAALGAQIEVPTPTGALQLTIPAGSVAARKLRLKGRGLPAATPGDFYFVLQIVLPPATTPAEQAVYRELARQFENFHPRANLGVSA